MSADSGWRRCSSCKKEIGFTTTYWVCNVSTCNRKRTGLVFCTTSCWDVHLPLMNHREAWAEERRAPTREAWRREQEAEQKSGVAPPAAAREHAAPAPAKPRRASRRATARGAGRDRDPGRGLEAQGLRARALGHEHVRLRLRAALRPPAPDVRPGDPARPARRPPHRDGPRLLAAYPSRAWRRRSRRWWPWGGLLGAVLLFALIAARPFAGPPLPDRWREARAGWLYRSAQIAPGDVEAFLRNERIDTILDLVVRGRRSAARRRDRRVARARHPLLPSARREGHQARQPRQGGRRDRARAPARRPRLAALRRRPPPLRRGLRALRAADRARAAAHRLRRAHQVGRARLDVGARDAGVDREALRRARRRGEVGAL